ncbi:MAG: hypothetical protein KIS67_26510 [Verrucomicrobiae bacterium]|nr:hypothetical protein [Verrucomicrobiae bacterium]
MASLLFCFFIQPALCADLPDGKVVWWGRGGLLSRGFSFETNGVVIRDHRIVDNAVAVAAGGDKAFVLAKGRVIGLGTASAPPAGTNAVSITTDGIYSWVFRGDGTVVGGDIPEHGANLIADLSNVTAIIRGGDRVHRESYLLLKKSGLVLALNLGASGPTTALPFGLVTVQGRILSNAVALTSMRGSPLVLKNDGTVVYLTARDPGWHASYAVISVDTIEDVVPTTDMVPAVHYKVARELMVGDQVVSNVVAIAGGPQHCLLLRNDGRVEAFGSDLSPQSNVPADLDSVIAIAVGEAHSLALKRDGTVVAWGNNDAGQTSVPTGLSNVVAIAAGNKFSLAITTGKLPPSVFVPPRGPLEIMAAKADLVCKAQVLANEPVTNTNLFRWGVFETKLRVISVLKGDIPTDEIVLKHYGELARSARAVGRFLEADPGGIIASGFATGPRYKLETGRSYLIFATKADNGGRDPFLRSAANHPNEFIPVETAGRSEAITGTSDARPIEGLSVKEAHWSELNLLLNDTNHTNQLYAIQRLSSMAAICGETWENSRDFAREDVMNAARPLLANVNDQVAIAAIGCFKVAPECATQLVAHAEALIETANSAGSASRRAAAIAVLSSPRLPAVQGELRRWIRDPAEEVRAASARLLLDYPGDFSVEVLRELAADDSAQVRATVAAVIGDGRLERLLPVLASLFADAAGQVHTNAGNALLRFSADQVADILKANLDTPRFHVAFVAKLAETDVAPWLDELTAILDARLKEIVPTSRLPSRDAARLLDQSGSRILVGAYVECWEAIRRYLAGLPPGRIASKDMAGYLDLLERTSRGSRRGTCGLYELYRLKHLGKRASAIRRTYPNEKWWFDQFDREHPDLKRKAR